MHRSIVRSAAALTLFLLAVLPALGQTGAISFNGTDQYADISAVGPEMTSSTTHTIEFWFNAAATQSDAGQVALFGVNTSTGGNVLLITLGTSSNQDGKIAVYDGVNAAVEITSTTSFLDGAPHHLAFVRSGSTGTLYVDGAAQGSSSSFTYAFGSTNHWSLGMEEDSGPTASDFFKGSIDEVRVWNAARSLDTLLSHMFQLTASNENLLGWWKCNEISGIVLSDASGKRNNGTLMNDVAFSSTVIPSRPTASTSPVTTLPSVTSMGVGWTRGDGDSCLVVVGTSAPTAPPKDLKYYGASTVFGMGGLVGSSSRVVYRGKGNNVNVTGLSIATSYVVTIYEFDSFHGIPYYGIDVPLTKSTSTLAMEPTVQPSSVSVSNVQAFSMTINWTGGNGANSIVILHANAAVSSSPIDGNSYMANSVWAGGSQLGSENFVVYKGNGNSVTVSGLNANTVYHAAIYEMNGSGGAENYNNTPVRSSATTLTGAPTDSATDITITNQTTTAATISCAAGNGQGRLIVMRKGQPVNADPVDGIVYAYSQTYGSHILSGDNVVVYSSTGSSVRVTGLEVATQYYVSIYEYNDVAGSMRRYLTPATTSVVFTLSTQPSSQSSATWYGLWNKGILFVSTIFGEKRLFVVKEGSPVDFTPTDGKEILIESHPSMVGMPLGGGNYAVYAGTAYHTISISNLNPGTRYYVSCFEYNGSGATANYVTNAESTPFITQSQPPSLITSAEISDTTTSNVTFCWQRGGSNTLVIMNAAASITASPADRTTYIANPVFAAGSTLGTGNYIVYSGTDTFVTVTGCSPGTTYSVMFIPFNVGVAGSENYDASSSASFSFTAPLGSPTVQASSISFPSVSGSGLTVKCYRGNGAGRLIVVNTTNITGNPVDGATYTGKATYGGGSSFPGGGYVLYSGSESTATMTAPVLETNYRVAVFEYNDVPGGIRRYLTPGTTSNVTIPVPEPTLSASNVVVTNLQSTSMTIGWTSGNGSKRLVVVKEGSPVTGAPNDFTSANFGSSTVFGQIHAVYGASAVLDGTGTSVNVTNLSPGTTYHVAIFEYNGSSGPTVDYKQTDPGTGSATTLAAVPLTAASGLSFTNIGPSSVTAQWTNGSGDGRLVLLRAGSPPDVTLPNGPLPAAHATLGAIAPFSGDQYVVAAGSGNSVTVNGLTEGTTYYFSVVEYNLNNAGAATFLNASTAQNSVVAESPLPVELTAFTGETRFALAELRWSTATEVNNHGFEVQRKKIEGSEKEKGKSQKEESGEEWSSVGFVEGHGTTNAPQSYRFTDKNAPAGKYLYRLVQTDHDGNRRASESVALIVGAAVKEFRLEQNYPNPFNPSTTIGFTLEKSGPVSLRVYDAVGRDVAVLQEGPLEAGVYHERVFDASHLSSGIYLVRLIADGRTSVKKMMLMK